MMHFTYQELDNTKDLMQGDILERKNELYDILYSYHKHYATHPDYKYFIVLTQSCDLIRRENRCKSPYITLAAVRSIDTLLRRQLKEYQHGSSLEAELNICAEEEMSKLKDFLVKLYNNNIPGYFFLRRDPVINLNSDYVAFLNLSISIKANEHYDKCVNTRFAHLEPIFQAKLGWQVGTHYSRVGTQDWAPDFVTEEKFSEIIDEQVYNLCSWAPRISLKKIKKLVKDKKKENPDYRISNRSLEEISKEHLEKQNSNRHKFTEIVTEIVKEIFIDSTNDKYELLEKRIMNSSRINQYIK